MRCFCVHPAGGQPYGGDSVKTVRCSGIQLALPNFCNWLYVTSNCDSWLSPQAASKMVCGRVAPAWRSGSKSPCRELSSVRRPVLLWQGVSSQKCSQLPALGVLPSGCLYRQGLALTAFDTCKGPPISPGTFCTAAGT